MAWVNISLLASGGDNVFSHYRRADGKQERDEYPGVRNEEELRHEEGAALLQRAAREVPVHRPEGEGDEQGELESVARAVGGIDALVDPKAKDADTVSLLAYLSPDQKFDKLLENQHVLAEPVVRNGKQATVGYAPDVWKTWE